MGVVFTQHVTDGTRRFFVLGIGLQSQLGHGVDDAPLHRLQAVADIGQGAVQDDVHRVVEVRLLGEVLQGQLLDALVIDLGRFAHLLGLSIKCYSTQRAQRKEGLNAVIGLCTHLILFAFVFTSLRPCVKDF